MARHPGVDELCFGGHISEKHLVDGREAEAQADPRDLAFVSVQPYLVGLNRPLNQSITPSRPCSRRLELARSDRSNGSLRSRYMASNCRFTDPMRH
jgi:hypothetical protein